MKKILFIALVITSIFTLQAKAYDYGGYSSDEDRQQGERARQQNREMQQDRDAKQQRDYINERNYQEQNQRMQQSMDSLPCYNAARCKDR